MMAATIDELHYLELAEVATLIRTGEISPVEVTRAQLDRIATLDSELCSYALVTADAAMAEAKLMEAEIAAGAYRGPLHGVPVAVKDLFWTKDVPTASGMAIHSDFRPGQDATAVRRLREAGAIVLGKLQMTEGAHSDYQPSIVAPKNPWDATYWPGISSSGPGVSIAAGLCYGALASDTGGSIRWPAAANGVTGLKPTWGRVSRHGAFELAATLDHVGTVTRSATDAGIMLGAIAGPDPLDPTALIDQVPNYSALVAESVRGLRIGVDVACNSDDVDEKTRMVLLDTIATFRELGAVIVEVRFPDVTQANADWSAICAVETAVAHEPTYPARKEEYGPTLASVIEAGRALSGLDYQKVLLRRLDFRGRVATLLAMIDVLLTPALPFLPPTLATIGEMETRPGLSAKLQRYTRPFNMTGSPTITLPGGFTDAGMPVAFQLVAADLGEAMLIRAGTAFQRTTTWHRHHPGAMP